MRAAALCALLTLVAFVMVGSEHERLNHDRVHELHACAPSTPDRIAVDGDPESPNHFCLCSDIGDVVRLHGEVHGWTFQNFRLIPGCDQIGSCYYSALTICPSRKDAVGRFSV